MPILSDELRSKMITFLTNVLEIPLDGVWARYYEEGYEDDDWYEDFRISCNADFEEHGCSKIVLRYSEFPQWVFKIPFCGEYIEEQDIYNEFHGSNEHYPIEESNNYCAGEAYIAELSRNAGLEDMFAQTYYLFDCNGTPIYVAEKVGQSRWCDAPWNNKVDSLYSARHIKNSFGDGFHNTHLDEETLGFFIDEYTEDRVYQLLDFLIINNIQDLHNGNVGFTSDMKIKILDYSGFDS